MKLLKNICLSGLVFIVHGIAQAVALCSFLDPIPAGASDALCVSDGAFAGHVYSDESQGNERELFITLRAPNVLGPPSPAGGNYYIVLTENGLASDYLFWDGTSAWNLLSDNEGSFPPGPHKFTVLLGTFPERVGWIDVSSAFLQRAGTVLVFSAPVPEPESYAMLIAGLGLLGFTARRRKLKAAQLHVQSRDLLPEAAMPPGL